MADPANASTPAHPSSASPPPSTPPPPEGENLRWKVFQWDTYHDLLSAVFVLSFLGGGGYLIWQYGQLVAGMASTGASLSQNSPSNPMISPSPLLCHDNLSILSSLIMATIAGLAFGIVYSLGRFVYRKFRDATNEHRRLFFEKVLHNDGSGYDISGLMGQFRDYEQLILDRRNLYWGLFIRFALAIIVVAFIAILIASCRIESQAGLPIITGIISFIIGQGADSVGRERPPPVVILSKDFLDVLRERPIAPPSSSTGSGQPNAPTESQRTSP
jgi:hypothetical protein